MSGGLILSILNILFWALSFLYFRSYLVRKTGPERILADFRDEVDKLIAEIDAATDRDSVLIEDRIKSLRTLLDEADRRIASYTREVERRSSEERAYAELGRYRGRSTTAPAVPPASTRGPNAGSTSSYDALSPPLSVSTPSSSPNSPSNSTPNSVPNVILKETFEPSNTPPTSPVPKTESTVASASIPEGSPESTVLPPPTGKGNENSGPLEGGRADSGPRFIRSSTPVEPKGPSFAERVAELSRAGFSADLIAKRLGATVAEVDLAIALAGRLDERYADDTGN